MRVSRGVLDSARVVTYPLTWHICDAVYATERLKFDCKRTDRVRVRHGRKVEEKMLCCHVLFLIITLSCPNREAFCLRLMPAGVSPRLASSIRRMVDRGVPARLLWQVLHRCHSHFRQICHRPSRRALTTRYFRDEKGLGLMFVLWRPDRRFVCGAQPPKGHRAHHMES